MSARVPKSWLGASWGICHSCGGDLPLIDGDNDHPDLPRSRRHGECPGRQTPGGRCGCYADCDLVRFAREADTREEGSR